MKWYQEAANVGNEDAKKRMEALNDQAQAE